MTRFKFHSPLLSQYSGHLVYIFTQFFSLSFPFNQDAPNKKPYPPLFFTNPLQVCFQMQLSFEEKSVVTGVFFQKLCAHFVCSERKEGKKEICYCITWIDFFTNVFSGYLTK